MRRIQSRVNINSPEYQENLKANEARLGEFHRRQNAARHERPQRDLDRLARQGKMLPRERLEMLLDPGTPFLELSTLAAGEHYDGDSPSASCITGIGIVCGREVLIHANDSTVKGGAEALIDGWYHTGDTGKLDENGNLWITGRISEVFKTTKGKFIQPIKLEDDFGSLVELEQVCVCGHGLDQPLLLATLSELGKGLSADELTASLSASLAKINAKLAAYERVNHVVITPEWTIMNGLLTPTLKLKRKSIIAHFKDQIEAKHTDTVVFM